MVEAKQSLSRPGTLGLLGCILYPVSSAFTYSVLLKTHQRYAGTNKQAKREGKARKKDEEAASSIGNRRAISAGHCEMSK